MRALSALPVDGTEGPRPILVQAGPTGRARHAPPRDQQHEKIVIRGNGRSNRISVYRPAHSQPDSERILVKNGLGVPLTTGSTGWTLPGNADGDDEYQRQPGGEHVAVWRPDSLPVER